MQKEKFKLDYLLKSNTTNFIYILHEYSEFDLEKFNEYLKKYNELIVTYKADLQNEQIKHALREATDCLIYTVACLNFHHDETDSFNISNYDVFALSESYEHYWGYEKFDNYVISKIRESIAKMF